MRYRLRDHLACCRCGQSLVLLDLAADRYFEMKGAGARALSDLLEQGAPPRDPAQLQHLLASGVLVPGRHDQSACAVTPIPAPTRDILGGDMPHAALATVLRVIWAQHRAERVLRRRRLIEVVHELAARARPAATAEPDALAQVRPIAAAFARSVHVIRSADRCLARSIALIAQCHRVRVYPRLVFGVSLEPFAAHAWAQLGDTVLTGDLDEVRRYTPILAVP